MVAKRNLISLCLISLILISIVSPSLSASIFKKRDTSAKTDKDAICESNMPCGWAIYSQFSRVVDYFMKNSCECPTNQQCIRTDDDLSVSAYVYRCREEKTKSNSSSGST